MEYLQLHKIWDNLIGISKSTGSDFEVLRRVLEKNLCFESSKHNIVDSQSTFGDRKLRMKFQ